MTAPLYLPAMAVACCLGLGKAATWSALLAGRTPLRRHPHRPTPVGALPAALPPLPPAFSGWDCRNNRLLALLADEIAADIQAAAALYGRHRVAVVLGTSTGGIAEGEHALAHYRRHGAWPAGFHYRQQEAGGAALFLAEYLALEGPAMVVATACSSAAKAIASGRRLIRAGLADAVVVGGADTLCELTQGGFASLEAVSPVPCLPFSAHRRGITIGEGGALFLLSQSPAPIALAGLAETSDAHHVSAPDPSGAGARAAMAGALADSGLAPDQVGYLNLHGTGTILNDSMEARAVAGLFPAGVPCSSTKGLTGHTLGAAGAVEAAILWLTLSTAWNPDGLLPPHVWDGCPDPDLPPLRLSVPGQTLRAPAALSNSFAFGGSNCCLALGRSRP